MPDKEKVKRCDDTHLSRLIRYFKEHELSIFQNEDEAIVIKCAKCGVSHIIFNFIRELENVR